MKYIHNSNIIYLVPDEHSFSADIDTDDEENKTTVSPPRASESESIVGKLILTTVPPPRASESESIIGKLVLIMNDVHYNV